MEPQFRKREGFNVLGVEDEAHKIEDVDPGFRNLWMGRFMKLHDAIEPQSEDKCYYAVWLGTRGDDVRVGTHLAGMAVGAEPDVPEGCVVRRVPAAEYAVFETTLQEVGSTTAKAFREYFPSADCNPDLDKPRFDLMPSDTIDVDSPVSVWIPVLR
jgi:predicted transcriptional regulator YdeE